MTLELAALDTFQVCRIVIFFAVVVRIECSSQNMNQAPHLNKFPQFLLFSKIKRQKDAISTQRSVLCACAGLHVTH